MFAVIHSDHTVQEAGCPSRHHNRPVCLESYRYLSLQACEGIQAPMWHSGICTFCCFCVSVLSVTQSYGSVPLYRSPGAALVPLTFQVHPRQLLPVAPLVWRWLTSVRFSQALNQSANWCRRVGCCWSVPCFFFFPLANLSLSPPGLAKYIS